MVPGIPQGGVYEALLFSPSAAAIVVQVRFPKMLGVSQLYWRALHERKYVGAATPLQRVSLESPVLSRTASTLYYSRWRRYQLDDGQIGCDWVGIGCFDLRRRVETTAIEACDVRVPSGYLRATSAVLLGPTNRASVLSCNLGLEREIASGSRVDFHIATVDVTTGRVRLLNQLASPFA